MNLFRSLHDYEEFVYTLQYRFPVVKSSSLVVVRRGRMVAVLQGELRFSGGYRLVVKERLSSEDMGVIVVSYGYEVWRNADKLFWYDSQPHPNDPALASTHPHHKHIPPNIKRNRIPAPKMSFTPLNLIALIEEIEELLQEDV